MQAPTSIRRQILHCIQVSSDSTLKLERTARKATNADSKAYLAALKDGRSYVTMGPLFFTYDGESFGDTISTDKKALKIDAQAVNGLEKVVLYRNGVK